ncbi:site-specific integrase [Lacrimispora amygdalina]|uniref:Site-specific integrase n=2 Tax=Lacrimispora amygdalina TaxID=253257 RepID=A0A3E2N5Z0_9FIRM|nr:site-specific integrase [[Clostridium] methoxybenzovorans]RFZ76415.1 site-specific integrase [Clostridium indicum]
MKDMLSTLINGGNITVSDVVSVLYENKEKKQMEDNFKLPQIGYRKDRNEYYLTVPVKFSKTGKRYPVYGKTEEEAVSNFKLEIALFNDHVHPDDTSKGVPNLHGMIEYTMKNFIYGNVRDTSYLKYENIVKKHLYPNPICKKQIDNISSLELTKFFRSEEIATLNASSLSTIKMVLSKTFLRTKEKNYRSDNPMEFVEVSYVKCKRKQRKKQIVLDSEIETLINYIFYASRTVVQYRYAPIFLVMLYGGLRIGEAMALREGDIDFDNKLITIDKQIAYIPKRDKNLDKIKMTQEEVSPKTDSSIRTIMLTDQVEFWINFMIEQNKKLPNRDQDYIFVNKKGMIPAKSSVNLLWHKLLEASEIPFCTPHKLRKTFITKLLNSGIALPDVAALAGHKNNSSVTLDSYYVSSLDNKQEDGLVDNIGNIFKMHDNKDNTLTTVEMNKFIG